MKHALALLLACTAARADIVAEVRQGDVAIQLHSDAGPCVGAARWAVYLDARQRIPGCWIFTPQGVQIAFLDGDVLTIPPELWRKPKDL